MQMKHVHPVRLFDGLFRLDWNIAEMLLPGVHKLGLACKDWKRVGLDVG